MAKVLTDNRHYTNIANSIRAKLGVETLYKPSEMSAAIDSIGGEKIEKEVELNMAEGDQVIEAADGELMTKVTVLKPDSLVPENIAKDVNVAGIIGTHSGGGGVDLEGDFLKYVVYQIDDKKKEIIICGILYSELYADTGSYDVNIPATFGAYSVVINSLGVG